MDENWGNPYDLEKFQMGKIIGHVLHNPYTFHSTSTIPILFPILEPTITLSLSHSISILSPIIWGKSRVHGKSLLDDSLGYPYDLGNLQMVS